MGKKLEGKDSIMNMARGAFLERVDYEMERVIENIFDVNTEAKAKRKITVTLEVLPNNERKMFTVNVTAKSTLATTAPVSTMLYVTNDTDGEVMIREMVTQVSGQMDFDGGEQEPPKILNLLSQAK